jgi:hypothetical protein
LKLQALAVRLGTSRGRGGFVVASEGYLGGRSGRKTDVTRRQKEAERTDTEGAGTFPLFVGWLVMLVVLTVLYLVVGIVDG